MDEVKVVATVTKNGDVEELSLTVAQSEEAHVIEASVSGRISRYEATSLFHALLELRRDLEREGRKLLCAGAQIDVWPSGMSMSMGGGRMAYRTRLGKQSTREDQLDIFSAVSPEEVVSVQEQVAYHNRWAAHFRDILTAKGS
jgi:hypothetical protein